MANIKHFSGETELKRLSIMDNAPFAAAFPGVRGVRYDGFSKRIGYAEGSNVALPVDRVIEYKSNPSKHVCDARCVNATGRVMRCECSCGGKNHGRGAFNCTSEAA